MKVTVIIKNVSEQFFTGIDDYFAGLNNLDNKEKFNYLLNKSVEKTLNVTAKIGNGSFRDKVELNQLLRKCPRFDYKLENRKGYKLATFEVTA